MCLQLLNQITLKLIHYLSNVRYFMYIYVCI